MDRLSCVAFLILLFSAGPARAHDEILIQIAAVTAEIDKDPGNARLYWRRGELYRLHEEWDPALADFERAAVADPGFDEIHVARARLLLDMDLPQAANAAVQVFLNKTPENTIALRIRAQSWEALEQFARAAADYRRVTELEADPQPDDYLSWAQAETRTGPEGPARALRVLDAGMEKCGALVTLQAAAIDLAIAADDYDAALRHIEAVMSKLRRKEAWLYRRGEVLEKSGRPEEALAAYRAAQRALDGLSPRMRAGPLTQALAGDVATAIARLAASASSQAADVPTNSKDGAP